jgi:hypothetical protein
VIGSHEEKPFDVSKLTNLTLDSQILQGGTHIPEIPKNNGIHDESQCAELILLDFLVSLMNLVRLAITNSPS